MPEQTFNCVACGAPNQPEAGRSRMACAYCGANLNIPPHLQTKAIPRTETISAPPKQIEIPRIDASETLRQAQPILARAWNLYAYWTWLRWILPACLGVFVVGVILCAALGMIPIVWSLIR